MFDKVTKTDPSPGIAGVGQTYKGSQSSQGAVQRRGVRLISFAGSLALFALFSAPSYAPDRTLSLSPDELASTRDSYRGRSYSTSVSLPRQAMQQPTEPLTLAVLRQSLADDGLDVVDFTRLNRKDLSNLSLGQSRRPLPVRYSGESQIGDFDAFEVRFAHGPFSSEEAATDQDLSFAQDGTQSEIGCLAQNIYFEARSEGHTGKLAVGQVVMNRVASKKFPNRICDVVRQGGERQRFRCQFSWWCDGKSDEPKDTAAWDESLALAKNIYRGRMIDPTNGALWYHADYVDPYWRSAFVQGPTIGRHIFYRAKPKSTHTQVATSSASQ